MRLTVTQVGNSIGVILPKEVAAHLKIKKGDSLFLTEVPEGYTVSSYDAQFAEAMDAAHEGMARYRNALRKLAE